MGEEWTAPERTRYEALLRGDISVRAEADDSPSFALCLRAATALLDGSIAPPAHAELAESPSRSMALARSDAALHAFISFDRHRLTRLCEGLGSTPGATFVRALGDIAAGASEAALDKLAASPGEDATTAVDVQVARALAELARGDVAAATSTARRASRMARTEEILSREYFANCVLARVRRYGRRTERAIRILSALSSVVPSPWGRWVGYELSLALGEAPPEAVHDALPSILLTELRALEACRSKRPDGDGRERLFQTGDIADVGHGLSGYLRHGAFVHLSPGQPGCRFLVSEEGAGAPGVRVMIPGDIAQRRTFALLATLALAPAAELSAAEAFHNVYGFPYVPAKHSGTLRNQLYLARKTLAPGGDILRDGDTLRLVVTQTTAILDPRCAVGLAEQVLSMLGGSESKVSAADVAKAVGAPLRTIQRILKELARDDLCIVDKEGKGFVYRVEDTTFFEPSMTRLGERRKSSV